MRMGTETYRIIEEQLAEMQELKPPLGTVASGGFAPEMEDDMEALTVISESIKSAGYDGRVKIGIDACATTFCKDGMYDMAFKTDESDPEDYLEPDALREQYAELLGQLPSVVSIEDPFDQEDWESWSALAAQAPELQVVADELIVSNPDRLEEAIEKQAANCLLVKLTHIGTITETIDCIKTARAAGWAIAVSAGQGETEDTFVADFAVGVSASQFKAGPACRSDKLAKYNQVLRIEEELGKKAKYVGEKFRNPFAVE